MKYLKFPALALILGWSIAANAAGFQFIGPPPPPPAEPFDQNHQPIDNVTVSTQVTNSSGTLVQKTDSGINSASLSNLDNPGANNQASATVTHPGLGIDIQLNVSATGTPLGVSGFANAKFTDLVDVYSVNELGLFSRIDLTSDTLVWEAIFNGNLPTPGSGTTGSAVGPENLSVQMHVDAATVGTLQVNGTGDTTSIGLLSPPNTVLTYTPAFGGGNNDLTLFAPMSDALNSEFFLSFTAAINDAAFQGQTSVVSFIDPWQFTVYDASGNIIPNLYFDSAYGVTYNVTDGAVPEVTGVPEPSTVLLFSPLVFLLWRSLNKRQRNGAS